ncbi:MAG: diguanylate cyclase, partial [Gammaproteobacteria bacterium]|nr:diguanylate cyclase [Gammaproteobacteria bacterium]
MPNESNKSLIFRSVVRYSATISLLAIIAVSIVMHLHKMQNDMQRLSVERQQKIELTYTLRTLIRERMVTLFQVINYEDPFAQDESRQYFMGLASRFIQVRAELEGLISSDEEQLLFKQLRGLTTWGTPHLQQVIVLYDNGEIDKARQYLLDKSLPVQNEVLNHCDSIISFYQLQANDDVERTLAEYRSSLNWLIALAGLAIIASLLIAYIENNQIRRDRSRLAEENLQRRKAEEALKLLHHELEQRVDERTEALNDSLKHLNQAQRISNMGHWEWDIATGAIKWSDQIFSIFGLNQETTEPSYELFSECIHPDDRELVNHSVERAIQGIEDYAIEHRIVISDGSIRFVFEQGEVSTDDAGNPIRMIGTVQDVTEQRELMQKLQLSDHVFNNTAEGIMITDRDNIILNVNAGFSRIMGYSYDEIVGQQPRTLKSGRQDVDFYKELWQSLNDHGTWQGELWNRRSNGEIIPVWMTINVVKDESNHIENYIAIFRDITEVKRSEEELWHIAHHDPLCDLPNRNLMNAYLEQSMAQAKRDDRIIALMLIDLDDFKNINDTLGHSAGDHALIAFAKILKGSVRESDVVARLAGDEFTIMLSDMNSANEAEVVAQKIIGALAEPVSIEGQMITLGASIGISFYPTDGATANYLLKCADQAMYLAKHEGKNSYR